MQGVVKIKSLLIIVVVTVFLFFNNCGDKTDNYPYIPDRYVDRYINMDLPAYSGLQFVGGWILLPNDGYKGIIVYHNTDGNYIAMERACSYRSYDTCAVVTVDSSNIFMRCGHYTSFGFEECCGSQFMMDGTVMKGPAIYSLKRYFVTKEGNTLHITN